MTVNGVTWKHTRVSNTDVLSFICSNVTWVTSR